MAEGNPVLALERGETVEMPPVLYVQGAEDVAHPRPDLDRFVEQYRKAGGQVDLKLFDGEAEGFINRNPTSAAAGQAVMQIIEFVHKHMA
jgi:dipeptidyl aminopeptidase/acylaminoacyl peptidase